MSLREAPIGTRAPAVGGGAWWKTEHGWKWNGPDSCGDTFPTPGGDWDGRLLPPRGVHTIVIQNWRPTTLNVLMRMHWGKANRVKQSDAGMLATYARLHEVPPATGRRRVSVRTVLTGRQKPTDPDALWKVLLDGLVKCRQLVDDTAALVELGPVAFDRGDRTATVITLEDL